MTYDALRDAEQWHVKPQQCMQAPIGDVHAKYVLDLRPLLEHHQSELQRERNQLAVERSAASSAREALVMCEARLKAATDDRDRLRDALEHAKCDAAEAQRVRDAACAELTDVKAELERCKATPVVRMHSDACDEHLARLEHKVHTLMTELAVARSNLTDATRDAHWNAYSPTRMARDLGKLEVRYAQRCDRNAQLRNEKFALRKERDAARDELERYKAAMGSASTVPPALTPGSVEAVIEAYRLITGHEPIHILNTCDAREWVDSAHPKSALPSPALAELYRAAHEMLKWLDNNAPGGRP